MRVIVEKTEDGIISVTRETPIKEVEMLDTPLVENEFEGEISDVLNQQLAWIEDNREDVCPRSESALHNLIDEIVPLYRRTLYKLRFLT